MVYFILAALAGALTIFSPCILPVVPFVFARVDQPFAKSGLPLLAGMALSFAAVASLGAVAGAWAVEANTYGRVMAMAVLALMGVTLIAPAIADRLTRPLVAWGSRLMQQASRAGPGHAASPVATSFVLGVATGLLWAPCAGPVLGLVLTAAALRGPSLHTSLLLLAYAGGAAASLAVVLNVGQRVFTVLKRSLGMGEWLRRGLGVAVLSGVVAIGLGFDTGALSTLSLSGQALEQQLLERLPPPLPMPAAREADLSTTITRRVMPVQALAKPRLVLPAAGAMPPLAGAVEWLNSPPLSAEELRGKVVLVEFWTFGCINCKNVLPHVREWHQKYKDQGLVVIGVHSPEFAFEKSLPNVKRALGDLDVPFPVAVDNRFAIWQAFHNNYWPAMYFVDARGQIRHQHIGEGDYETSEQVIQQLLDEAQAQRKTS